MLLFLSLCLIILVLIILIDTFIILIGSDEKALLPSILVLHGWPLACISIYLLCLVLFVLFLKVLEPWRLHIGLELFSGLLI